MWAPPPLSSSVCDCEGKKQGESRASASTSLHETSPRPDRPKKTHHPQAVCLGDRRPWQQEPNRAQDSRATTHARSRCRRPHPHPVQRRPTAVSPTPPPPGPRGAAFRRRDPS